MFDIYRPLAARVAEVIEETPTIKTLVFELEKPFEFRAGQFVQLTMPGLGEAPFTPSSSPYEPSRLEVTILRTGKITEALHNVKVGSTLGIRGPFGKGYPVEEVEGKEILVVGGGVGLAPLRSLLYVLFRRIDRFERLSIKYGARTPDELLYRRMFREWASKSKVDFACTVDRAAPGWDGNVGVVTTLLDGLDINISNAAVFSCGPGIMLKFVTYKCLELGFKPNQIYLSLNRKMSCGIGKCGRCNIGRYYVCKDGPDFNYELIKDYPEAFE